MMADQYEDDRTLGSSLSSSELSRVAVASDIGGRVTSDIGGKSPGKVRKLKLFKRSAGHDDNGLLGRSSGRGKNKKNKKLAESSSKEQLHSDETQQKVRSSKGGRCA